MTALLRISFILNKIRHFLTQTATKMACSAFRPAFPGLNDGRRGADAGTRARVYHAHPSFYPNQGI
jgi:hypothetical protein